MFGEKTAASRSAQATFKWTCQNLPVLARTATACVLVHLLSHHCPFLCRRPRSISRYVCPNLLCSHLLFSLGPGLHKILCVSSKSVISVPACPMEVLQSNPVGLHSQNPWGFLVPLSNPQAGKPDMGLRTFTSMEELLWYYCSPVCGSPT